MKLKSWMLLTLTFLLSILLLGCQGATESSNDEASTSSSDTQETVDNEDNTSDSSETSNEAELIVSTMGTSLPWSYIDDQGNWTGLDGEVWSEIESRSGINIEVLRGGGFDATLGNVSSGRAHIASNHFTPTPERLEQFACTKPYSTDTAIIAIRPEDAGDLTNVSDFEGKTIGIISGHSAEIQIRDGAEEYGYNVATYENTDPAMRDLTAGTIDGFASNQSDLAYYMEQTGAEYASTGDVLEVQPAVFLVGRGESVDTAEIINQINDIIDEMLEDGTLATLTEKWFGENMTQYIDEAVADYQENYNQDVSNGFIE